MFTYTCCHIVMPLLKCRRSKVLAAKSCIPILYGKLRVHSGVGSNLQVGGTMPARSTGRKFFDVPPHFSLMPPT